MKETGIVPEANTLGSSVRDFVGSNDSYYEKEFDKIQSATKFPWSWNLMAALVGPFWGAARGLWGYFWTFMVLEILALVQIGKGLWGELGADKLARVEKLTAKYTETMAQADVARAAGESGADAIYTRAENLNKVIDRLIDQAAAASSGALGYLLAGIVLFIVFRAVQGYYANLRYEQQYLAWRAEPQTTPGHGAASRRLRCAPRFAARFTTPAPCSMFFTHV